MKLPEGSTPHPTVSACLIVKDEASNLPRCLASLEGQVDQIVLVDTGSTDETLAIARAAADRGLPLVIGHFAWCDDFAAARNAALDLATGDWILVIDADEEFVVADPLAWRKSLATREAHAYMVALANLSEYGTIESRMAATLRCFRRHPEIRFVGRLHEDVSRALITQGWQPTLLASASFRHHGYTPAAMAAKKKVARNRALAESMTHDDPTDPSAWFYLTGVCWLERNAAATLAAIAGTRRLIAQGKTLPPHRLRNLLLVECWAHEAAGEAAKALAVLDEGLATFPAYPEFLYERGRLRALAGNLCSAFEDFEACLVGPTAVYEGTLREGVTGYLVQVELMALYAARADYAGAHTAALAAAGDPACPPVDTWRLKAVAQSLSQYLGGELPKANPPVQPPPATRGQSIDECLDRLDGDPRDPVSFTELALACFDGALYDKALIALSQAIALDAGNAAAFVLLGEVLAALGQPEWSERAFGTALQLAPDHPAAGTRRLEERDKRRRNPDGPPLPPELASQIEALLSRLYPTVSACLIVKNEALNLPRCLASLEGWVDQIVIVDTGSTDETLAIAQAAKESGLPIVIGHFAWCDDFSAARNASLALATGDWVLAIDADEELEVPDREAWLAMLRYRVPAGYAIRQRNLGPGAPCDARTVRIFQRLPQLLFNGRLHETVDDGARQLGWPIMGSHAMSLAHHGYAPEAMVAHDKAGRNVRLAEREVAEDAADPQAHRHLVISLAVAGRHTDALAAHAHFMTLPSGLTALGDLAFLQYVLTIQALLRHVGRLTEAHAMLTEALERLPGHPDLLYERGATWISLGDLNAGRGDLQACLATVPADPADRAGQPFLFRPDTLGALAQQALSALPPKS